MKKKDASFFYRIIKRVIVGQRRETSRAEHRDPLKKHKELSKCRCDYRLTRPRGPCDGADVNIDVGENRVLGISFSTHPHSSPGYPLGFIAHHGHCWKQTFGHYSQGDCRTDSNPFLSSADSLSIFHIIILDTFVLERK